MDVTHSFIYFAKLKLNLFSVSGNILSIIDVNSYTAIEMRLKYEIAISIYGAIQIIRDTFFTLFRPPSPPCDMFYQLLQVKLPIKIVM
jgi:hypothetical protein